MKIEKADVKRIKELKALASDVANKASKGSGNAIFKDVRP